MTTLEMLLITAIIFLPLIVGYGRCLDDWTMTKILLCFLVPVLGWFVALGIAILAER